MTNPENIAEILKAQYESVFSHPVKAKVISDPKNFFQSSNADDQLDNVMFNRDPQQMLLQDQMAFQPFYLKSANTDPIATIFSSRIIPDLLKTAFVKPVHMVDQEGITCETYISTHQN